MIILVVEMPSRLETHNLHLLPIPQKAKTIKHASHFWFLFLVIRFSVLSHC